MKKFNWGWGLASFYSLFVVFMLVLVWMANAQKVEMVTTDYYKKELAYQQHINKVTNAAGLKMQPAWQVGNKAVAIQFPAGMAGGKITGRVTFYRPNDSTKDLSFAFVANEKGKALIHSPRFVKGVYRMQIEWNAGELDYYNEGIINMN